MYICQNIKSAVAVYNTRGSVALDGQKLTCGNAEFTYCAADMLQRAAHNFGAKP